MIDSLLSIVYSVVTERKMIYLLLLLFLRLLDEAVHDAGRDDDGGEDGLGHNDHSLVFHIVLMSSSCLSHKKLFSFSLHFTLTWIFCQLSSLPAQITGGESRGRKAPARLWSRYNRYNRAQLRTIYNLTNIETTDGVI